MAGRDLESDAHSPGELEKVPCLPWVPGSPLKMMRPQEMPSGVFSAVGVCHHESVPSWLLCSATHPQDRVPQSFLPTHHLTGCALGTSGEGKHQGKLFTQSCEHSRAPGSVPRILPSRPSCASFRLKTRVECFAFLGLSLIFLLSVEQQSSRAQALLVCPILILLLIRGSKCNDSSELGWPLN